MNSLIEFLSFSDPNVRYVSLGALLLGASSAIVGCFTFLQKRALVGDAVAHAVLPGVCLAFILGGSKNPFYLFIGAFITGWLSLIILDFIVSRSKIKEDTAIGLVLSVFFGIGILLLTSIQHSGSAAQSGLDNFLFGKAASMVGTDLVILTVIAVLLITTIILLFKEFTLLSFDAEYAQALGFPVRYLQLTLTTLTVLAVVIGIQAVGIVLMAAMLITPAAAARFWTDKIKVMLVLASVFGAFSGIFGSYISYIAPAMPTGPWIVMVVSFIAIFSFFFAPKKGIIFRYFKQKKNQDKILEENILKLIYKLGKESGNFFQERSIQQLLQKQNLEKSQLLSGLKRLQSHGYVTSNNSLWMLNKAGKNKGQRILKLHRLWEQYLTQYLRIAPDHVHEDAETIEHIITPEIEAMLEQTLNFPKEDPHSSEIPYR